MPDAGPEGPPPYSRRFPSAAYAQAYLDLVEMARRADSAGWDSFWVTEHHFQHEGYEPVANGLLVGLALAGQTQHLRFGTMFNVVPLWHPVRLAEDFAIADVMSNGRMIFGTGWGSVQHEAALFGRSFSRSDDDGNASNREEFVEAMEVMRRAWSQERFCFSGRYFTLPKPGVREYPDGPEVDSLTLVPRPQRSVEVWQALNSENGVRYAARYGHVGVLNLGRLAPTLAKWRRYGELLSKEHGRPFRWGERRVLKVTAHVADSGAAAREAVRPGHAERFRYLAMQRPLVEYQDEQGVPYSRGRVPTLEDSIEQGGWIVGSDSEVRDRLQELTEQFGLEYLIVQLQIHGMELNDVLSQIDRVARLGA